MSESPRLSISSHKVTASTMAGEQVNTQSEEVGVQHEQMGFKPVPLTLFSLVFVVVVYKLSKLRKTQ